MTGLFEDVRYALRLLLRTPGITAAAVLTFALVIGANTAVFSVVYGALLRPLPYERPADLVDIRLSPFQPINRNSLGKLETLTGSFHALSTFESSVVELDDDRVFPQYTLVRVSSTFLSDVVRLDPALGRGFTSEDERAGATPVAILSHAFWSTHFGSDPAALGRDIRFRGYPPLRIIGVLPADFRSPGDLMNVEDVWTLRNTGAVYSGVGSRILARLQPGMTVEAVAAQLAARSDEIVSPGTDHSADAVLDVTPLSEAYSTGRAGILLFFAAVLCLLVLGIANAVTLELGQLPRFEREFSVRAALGATRGRLMRFMLTRMVLIGVIGGLLGVLIATAMHGLVVSHLPRSVPRGPDVRIDMYVWTFSAVITLLSALVAGLVPAWRASAPDTLQRIGAAGRQFTETRRANILQDLITAVESGVAFMLVLAAGLFIYSLWNLLSVDLGFNPAGVTTLQVRLPRDYDASRAHTFFRQVIDRLALATQGDSVAVSTNLPLHSTAFDSVSASGPDQNPSWVSVSYMGVSERYFETLGIPIVAGRRFTPEEGRLAAPVVVIDEAAASILWPGQIAIGQKLRRRGPAEELTVIGVAARVKTSPTDPPMPTLYATFSGSRIPFGALLVARTSMDGRSFEQLVAGMEPNALLQFRSANDMFSASIDAQRFSTTILTGFAITSLALAALGIYAAVALSVSRRTREVGIRMALGAAPLTVFRYIVLRGMAPAVGGMAVGLGGFLAISTILAGYLFEVKTTEVSTHILVMALFIAVSAAAGAIPARRAARIDPVEALQHD